MHEMSIAQSLFSVISGEVRKYKAKPVSARISCGIFNAVNEQLLKEAIAAISEGTDCEGIKIKIEQKPLKGICRDCGKEFEVDFKRGRCPGCGKDDFELQPDAPLVLEEIEFEGK
jgi:hydrogenase nickel incorporation protein HypA/HybF